MQLPYRKPTKFSHITLDPLISQEKFDELTKKQAKLKEDRKKVAKDVARLAEFGDFSENVEYQLAKGRLRKINEQLLITEAHLNHATIVKKKNTGVVEIGSTVTVTTDDKEKTFHILGSSETNPIKGIISYTSPIGSALIGHTIGETIEIFIAGKPRTYTITHIQ